MILLATRATAEPLLPRPVGGGLDLQAVARGRGVQPSRLTAAANHEPERAYLETRNRENPPDRPKLVSYENKRLIISYFLCQINNYNLNFYLFSI